MNSRNIHWNWSSSEIQAVVDFIFRKAVAQIKQLKKFFDIQISGQKLRQEVSVRIHGCRYILSPSGPYSDEMYDEYIKDLKENGPDNSNFYIKKYEDIRYTSTTELVGFIIMVLDDEEIRNPLEIHELVEKSKTIGFSTCDWLEIEGQNLLKIFDKNVKKLLRRQTKIKSREKPLDENLF